MKISGRTFRLMRINTGLTVREFAQLAGFAPSYVSMIENGHKPVTPKIQKRFLDVYGLTNEDFIKEAM